MKICIFNSWQSDYQDDCKMFIGDALKQAVEELNSEQKEFEYYVVNGGGGLKGSQEINVQIDNALKYEACLVVSDYTHVGPIPQKDNEGNWIKKRALPNPNVIDETARAKERVGTMQIIKVCNTFYGNYRKNIEMYFDIQNERFPLSFNYHKGRDNAKAQLSICKDLKESLKESIVECTGEFLKNQKVRFSPFVPLMDVYKDKMFDLPFFPAEKYKELQAIIAGGKTFRLLALPGMGKTRMVCEAFRGVDMNIYYCDCKNRNEGVVREALEKLLDSTNDKQIVVIDNCDQKAHSTFWEEAANHKTECQLITLYYDTREIDDSGVSVVRLTPNELPDVVDFLLNNVDGLSDKDRDAIKDIAGGFPLMVNLLIDQYNETGKVASVSQAELFNRMLNIKEENSDDLEKKKVLTAFAIFKYLGLFGNHEQQGKFVSSNQILTPLVESDNEKRFTRFLNVYGEYSKGDLLDKEGNYVLMRPIPLAIYLAKKWYQIQTVETMTKLVEQIGAIDNEWTKNQLVDSLSKRITLLADVPLAQELVGNLLSPSNSPFLSEEVVLTKLGSRLFLAFSEVNPEACAAALYKIISLKNDNEIAGLEPARRNLAWALDHLAFDGRSFHDAMLTLARLSLVETENGLANNTTCLFIDRFAIMLPGTEVNLMARVELLKVLSSDERYDELIKQSLHRALSTGHFSRTGGAEKQGVRSLKDYYPTYEEVVAYYNACFDMLVNFTKTQHDLEEVAKTLAKNARGYYMQGMEGFLFNTIEIVAPKKDYTWEEMKDSLSFLIDYDAKKRNNYNVEKALEWKEKLTKNDYVYKLLHIEKDLYRHFDISFEKQMMLINERFGEMAKELIDERLFENHALMMGVMQGECLHYNSYGMALSSYSKEVGLQKRLLDVLLDYVLHQEVSRDAESMLIYFLLNVDDRELLEFAYGAVLNSEKKRMLPAMYAIKAEGDEKLSQLFGLLDKGDLTIKDFIGYFNYRALNSFDVKYVAGRLLDYGAEGAEVVLSRCYNFLYGEKELDAEYEAIARRCLMQVNLNGFRLNDFVYLQSMNNYLTKHRDEELALHIQSLQEKEFEGHYSGDNYYLGQLYGKVFKSYTDLLKPRVFELLENKRDRHSWFDLLRTSYPQENGLDSPFYTFIPIDEWFGWLQNAANNDRAYALAMMFSYSKGSGVSDEMLRLIEESWCDEVKDALGARFHSYSWSGTGIPLYRSRITLYEDYIMKLKNEEAKEWFRKDIVTWEKEINQEILNNAHERAIYD